MLKCSRSGSRTPETPEMKLFVILVYGWTPPTNAIKVLILDVAMVSLRYVSVKQLIIKNRFLMLVWSLLWIIWTLIANTNFFNSWFTAHYNFVQKLLSAHRFCHSVFTRRKTNFSNLKFSLYFPGIPCILLSESYMTLHMALVTTILVKWCNCSYNCGENPRNVPVRSLFELLWKISSFKDICKSF